VAVYRGFFGEPYCSIGCQLLGGTDATQALMQGVSGPCIVCGKGVQASPYEDRGAVVCDVGGAALICMSCMDRGKAMVAARSSCSRCGDALD
jgi:hypothetical protein